MTRNTASSVLIAARPADRPAISAEQALKNCFNGLFQSRKSSGFWAYALVERHNLLRRRLFIAKTRRKRQAQVNIAGIRQMSAQRVARFQSWSNVLGRAGDLADKTRLADKTNLADKTRASRSAILLLALAFLFETWIWEKLVAVSRWIADRIPWAQFRERARENFSRWPAIFSVLAFGLPFLLVEGGCTFSVVLIALGHIVMGTALYLILKLALLTGVALIFDLTRDKLMSLPWFVFLYDKLLALHHYASRIVAPYRDSAMRVLRRIRSRSRAIWLRFVVQGRADRNPATTYIKVD